VITPSRPQRLVVRCNVGDFIVANLAMNIVFFFERHLETDALTRAFTDALTQVPIFAGRMTLIGGRMAIRCEGQGVPFTCSSSNRTLQDAIRSTTDDTGGWLIDPVNGATARWGMGPLCKVKVTHLRDGATAIGVSWHHVIGDMATLMIFMNAWVAAATGKPIAAPVVVEDRAAYLDERLPTDGSRTPGVRFLGTAELARSLLYLVKDARKQRTLSVYFGEDEIARMRREFGEQMWLSANDVVCAHISESLMCIDPAVDRRTLAIVVNTRDRCGLDRMLVGNIITTMNTDVRSGESAGSIAERIRANVERLADNLDMRVNQEVLDAAGALRAARCVSTAFNPYRWNPLITNLSGFGVYRVHFEDTFASYATLVLQLPVAGGGVLMEGAGGHGMAFQISLPPSEFQAMSSPAMYEHLHRFRSADDEIPRLHRAVHG
jgi:hypothetical protein